MNKVILIITILGLLLSANPALAQSDEPLLGIGKGKVVGIVIGVRIGTCPECGAQILIVTVRIDSDHDGDYDENDLEYEIIFHEWTEDLYNALLAAKENGGPHLLEWTWKLFPGHKVRKLTRVIQARPDNIIYNIDISDPIEIPTE